MLFSISPFNLERVSSSRLRDRLRDMIFIDAVIKTLKMIRTGLVLHYWSNFSYKSVYLILWDFPGFQDFAILFLPGHKKKVDLALI